MSDSTPEAQTVPRPPSDPTPDAVFDEMQPCEPYVVADLVDRFDDASRWTIQRRLESLHDDGRIRRKKHGENRVSYWIEPSSD